MSNLDEIAKKNNYKGIAISVGIHLIILLLFLWVTVWKEPYPPHPEYGIELNFGMANTGSNSEPVASEQTSEPTEELVAEDAEEATDEASTSPVDEDSETQESADEAVSEVPEETIEEVATQEEGLIEQKSSEKAAKSNESQEVKKAAESKKAEEKKPEVKEKPKTNPNALFPGNNPSQGETESSKNDQGTPDGTVDSKAMMGPKGGGDGSKLEMSGWAWNSPPDPKDNSDQNGQIIFKIKVDDNGEVIAVDLEETTVSPDVVRIYQREVEKLSFYKTSAGTTLNTYTGKITFLIRSR